MKIAVSILSLLLAIYLMLLGGVWFAQERLIFAPALLKSDHQFNLPTDVSEFWVQVPDARLNGLHLRRPKPKAVVFFLHGNAGSLASWFVNLDFYRQMNVDLVMIDYRGFGKSTGTIQSEAQLVDDVKRTWK